MEIKMLYIVLVLVCCLIQGESTCRRNLSGKVYGDPKDVGDRLKEVAKNKKLLAVVEASFLKFMGLKKRPKKHRKKTIKVPPHLWKIYRKWSDRAYKDSVKQNSDTARVIHHSVTKDSTKRSHKGSAQKLHFDVSRIPKNEKLHKAELHLFTESLHKSKSFQKHKFIRIYKNNQTQNSNKIIHLKKLPKRKIGYLNFDVTDVVKQWLNNSIDTSLYVDENNVDNTHLHLRKRRSFSDEEWLYKRPALIIYSLDNKEKPTKIKQREKREASQVFKKDQKKLSRSHLKAQKEKCRLRNFELNFKDISWDEWILAPAGYDINYCLGDCPQPLGNHYNTTNHAVIQNTILTTIKKDLVPPLCCVPTTLEDQTFLYLDDEGQLQLKNPVDMIALGCGCH